MASHKKGMHLIVHLLFDVQYRAFQSSRPPSVHLANKYFSVSWSGIFFSCRLVLERIEICSKEAGTSSSVHTSCQNAPVHITPESYEQMLRAALRKHAVKKALRTIHSETCQLPTHVHTQIHLIVFISIFSPIHSLHLFDSRCAYTLTLTSYRSSSIKS